MTEESMSRHVARCQQKKKKSIENDLLGAAIHHTKEAAAAAAASSKMSFQDNCADSVSDLSGDSRRRGGTLAKHRTRFIISPRRSPSEIAATRADHAQSIRGIFLHGEQRQALEDMILDGAFDHTGNS
mmetsp:Transcript_23942/g.33607  ORF Transcript_23942/g.33607 Transcript_23942/m.33607 type:complete len:128 (+) Transcript_23942:2222-2605(+)